MAANAAEASAPAPQTTPAPRPSRWRRALPFASLALGVASALLMDRGPRRAGLVAVAAVTLWVTLLAVQWLGRTREPGGSQPRSKLVAIARRFTIVATQSLVQLALFFALPFYVNAANRSDPGHLAFLGLLGSLSLAALWDPLSERLLTAPLSAPLLPAAGSFAALTAVLPGLGLSTEHSLWVAAAVASAGALSISAASAPPERRGGVVVAAMLVAALLPFSLWLGAARIVPAAPLRLVKGEIGTQREGRWVSGAAQRFAVAPPRLFCATAIASPLGVRDRLFHVWEKDGATRARVALEIRGGRDSGFRTLSRITLGPRERGTFVCSVVTASGQRLGAVRVRVGA